jgi:hypothetical protein
MRMQANWTDEMTHHDTDMRVDVRRRIFELFLIFFHFRGVIFFKYLGSRTVVNRPHFFFKIPGASLMPPFQAGFGETVIPYGGAAAGVMGLIALATALFLCSKKKNSSGVSSVSPDEVPDSNDADVVNTAATVSLKVKEPATRPGGVSDALNEQTSKMIDNITNQICDFEAQLKFVQNNGSLQPELLAAVQEESVGVIGTLFVVHEALLRQLAETEASLQQKAGSRYCHLPPAFFTFILFQVT